MASAINPLESHNSMLLSVPSRPGESLLPTVKGIVLLMTDLIDGLYFDILVELDGQDSSVSRKLDLVEQIYRKGNLFSVTQCETLISRVKQRMSKIDFSAVEVTSVAGIRLSMMLKQEAQKGKHRYDENNLLAEHSPVKYSSSFKRWFSTSTKRCKLIVQLMEQCMNSETTAI